MAQYIDKDAVVAEIERRKHKLLDNIICESDKEWVVRTAHQLNRIILFLNTLEVKEVDFEKETKKWWKEHLHLDPKNQLWMDAHQSIVFAKHFFELGLSVSNSTKVTAPDIDDVLKENGVNPDSKEAKIIKESYFMAIEKLAQKGE